MMSRGSIVPYEVFLPETYLYSLQLERGFSVFQIKKRQKVFTKNLLHSRKFLSRIYFHALQKHTLRLDRTDHRGVTLLRIFPCHFGDRMNIYFPFIRSLFEPLVFVFVIPDISANIRWICANLKPTTHAKFFHHFGIVRIHDQNYFSGIRVIPSFRCLW